MNVAGPLIVAPGRLCLAIFVLEIALKLFAFGWRFFRDGWNLFDVSIVAIALIPAAQSLFVIRALRLLRIVLVSPNLRWVVEGPHSSKLKHSTSFRIAPVCGVA